MDRRNRIPSFNPDDRHGATRRDAADKDDAGHAALPLMSPPIPSFGDNHARRHRLEPALMDIASLTPLGRETLPLWSNPVCGSY